MNERTAEAEALVGSRPRDRQQIEGLGVARVVERQRLRPETHHDREQRQPEKNGQRDPGQQDRAGAESRPGGGWRRLREGLGQGRLQGGDAGPAAVPHRLQAAVDRGQQRGRQVRAQLPERDHPAQADREKELLEGLALEGVLAREHAVSDHADGPDIRTGIDVPGGLHLLRRHVLHDHEGRAARQLSDIEDAGDMVIGEAGSGHRLALEPPPQPGLEERFFLEHLDGDALPELLVEGEVDLAHPAAPQQPLQPVLLRHHPPHPQRTRGLRDGCLVARKRLGHPSNRTGLSLAGQGKPPAAPRRPAAWLVRRSASPRRSGRRSRRTGCRRAAV
jgi:hypothetical protein